MEPLIAPPAPPAQAPPCSPCPASPVICIVVAWLRATTPSRALDIPFHSTSYLLRRPSPVVCTAKHNEEGFCLSRNKVPTYLPTTNQSPHTTRPSTYSDLTFNTQPKNTTPSLTIRPAANRDAGIFNGRRSATPCRTEHPPRAIFDSPTGQGLPGASQTGTLTICGSELPAPRIFPAPAASRAFLLPNKLVP